ncbi:MAG: GTP 3',8-cyclase MoaA [Euryarchaeota archaeon]|nr:GTP 3',8-cyclase MoaA [Euryarchaeota archaeon]
MRLVDRRERPLHDLRISITDRCNFRCTYCMPREHFGPEHDFLKRDALLTYEEITTVVRALLPTGLRKVRLTGGEPLLRRDITTLISMIREVGPDLDLALTTNGALLKRHAVELQEAGLDRVTVSLDAMDQTVFQAMADTTQHTPDDIMEGIDHALSAGLGVKVNTVVQKNINEEQIPKLAAACVERNIPIRFIEYMDVGNTNAWVFDEVVSGAEIRQRLEEQYGVLVPEKPKHKGEVARRYTTSDGDDFGFIESVSNPFCGDCTRARLSAHGSLYTCLFSSKGHDLRAMLRMGAEGSALSLAIRSIWERRDDRYSMDRTSTEEKPAKVEMSFIGG